MAERFGEYDLIRLIATGGMAEIYLAKSRSQAGVSRRLVVKRMLPELAVRPDFVTMFLDEARLAARLAHPNIVQTFNLGQEDKAYYMAMELVDGPHLGQLFAHSLRQRQPLPIELCAYICARAADGLHYAHTLRERGGAEMGVVHRDISPQNILVSRHGDIKVTDFGVAKASTQEAKTRTGVIKGKVAYMSPEQCLGDQVDARTDVFALGIVLYELLTRRRLFRDKSDLLVMQRITNQDIPPPSAINPQVDEELDALCLQTLAKKREDRVTTTAELSESLDRWLAANEHFDCRGQLTTWMDAHAEPLLVTSETDVTNPKARAPGDDDGISTPATGSVADQRTALARSKNQQMSDANTVIADPMLEGDRDATVAMVPFARSADFEEVGEETKEGEGPDTEELLNLSGGRIGDGGPATEAEQLPVSIVEAPASGSATAMSPVDTPSRRPMMAAAIGLVLLLAGGAFFAASGIEEDPVGDAIVKGPDAPPETPDPATDVNPDEPTGTNPDKASDTDPGKLTSKPPTKPPENDPKNPGKDNIDNDPRKPVEDGNPVAIKNDKLVKVVFKSIPRVVMTIKHAGKEEYVKGPIERRYEVGAKVEAFASFQSGGDVSSGPITVKKSMTEIVLRQRVRVDLDIKPSDATVKFNGKTTKQRIHYVDAGSTVSVRADRGNYYPGKEVRKGVTKRQTIKLSLKKKVGDPPPPANTKLTAFSNPTVRFKLSKGRGTMNTPILPLNPKRVRSGPQTITIWSPEYGVKPYKKRINLPVGTAKIKIFLDGKGKSWSVKSVKVSK